ncbi:hypothetical protein KSP39_PZI000957 [Platanthera zijinensis]|uniref:Nuclease HARBI1 n=1 Tax=Platanthera zijinensis TaxID=2320716 RepID=A0AAP0GFJ7_9ASPA
MFGRKRWRILQNRAQYTFRKQHSIIVAIVVLHNFILRHPSRVDPEFSACDVHETFIFPKAYMHGRRQAQEDNTSEVDFDINSEFEVDYKSQEYAAIVFAALDVDKELQPDKVKRQISISDGDLKQWRQDFCVHRSAHFLIS